ncbi:hypothetical protein SARC_17637, partial [Sphaeroforma arctica JP610]
EPPRFETHWDFLLKEMGWMAVDFYEERKWKRAVAKHLSSAVMHHFLARRARDEVRMY